MVFVFQHWPASEPPVPLHPVRLKVLAGLVLVVDKSTFYRNKPGHIRIVQIPVAYHDIQHFIFHASGPPG